MGIGRDDFLKLLETNAAIGKNSDDPAVQATATWLEGMAVLLHTLNPAAMTGFLALLKMQQQALRFFNH